MSRTAQPLRRPSLRLSSGLARLMWCSPTPELRLILQPPWPRSIRRSSSASWKSTYSECGARCAGYILITSSLYAYLNGVINAPYAMSKAAVAQLGRALRVELAGTGASAGVLYPGWVNTGIARNAFGGHDTVTRLVAHAYPPLLRDAIEPERVAEKAVAGIVKRSPRIVVPRRWIPYIVLNGLLDPLSDALLTRDRMTEGLIKELEQSREVRSHR
jgi:NAD(P)-dependent dehydrogenase (short-subunit alcohol dehydrogenase family)